MQNTTVITEASEQSRPQTRQTEVARIEGFDRNRLPWFSRVETLETHEPKLNPETLQMEDRVERLRGVGFDLRGPAST